MGTRGLLLGSLLLSFVLPHFAGAEELDPPILLLTADPGTPIADIFRVFGVAEMRTFRQEDETRREELVYRIDDREMVVARFIDGALDEVLRGKARTPAPPEPNLTDEQLKRRGRTLLIRLGWSSEKAAAWLEPDGVIAEDAMRGARRGWQGGDLWVYQTGPYITQITVRDGRVVEFMDRHVHPDATPTHPQLAGK